MSGKQSSVGTGGPATLRPNETRFGWLFDPKLVTVVLGSLAIVFVGGLIQVSHGAY